jgi:hypothetical protein
MHAAGRGRGRRLLYWFRTPPGVRVGRAPIDETAIRLLEQHNPDVQFDWTRILKAPPPAEGQGRRDSRENRDRDQRGRREARSPQRSRSGGGPPPGPAAPPPPRPERAVPVEIASAVEPAEHLPAPLAEYADTPQEGRPAAAPGAASDTAPVNPQSGHERAEPVEAAELFETRRDDEGSASYKRLGAEGLGRLRARYAEVMARIAERPLEEDAREELKQRAERLNPDGWVTADEVTAALEQYETVFEGLRGVVGRHPRGGRRGRR